MARSLRNWSTAGATSVVFAKGVADSSCVDDTEFSREISELYALIHECTASGERLVYLSGGGAVYGPQAGIRRETSPVFPQTAYGRHQLVCEAVLQAAPIRSLIVRLPNVIGEGGNLKQLVPALVGQAVAGHAWLQQHATRDILRAEDAARMIAALCDHPDVSGVVNVASGYSTPVVELFETIQSILGTSARIEMVPGGEDQRFSVERLASLISADLPFSGEYVSRALVDYVPRMLAPAR
jgi:nucleoside-diphosphate-sugar epimerase